jgi:hypothetical protein
MPGFGRGPPGPPPPPGRGPPGRGGMALPGVGPPGRGAAGRGGALEPPPTPNGLLPTRGPGRGPAPPGRGPAGATGAAGASSDAAGRSGSAGAATGAGAGAGVTSTGARGPGRGLNPGSSGPGCETRVGAGALGALTEGVGAAGDTTVGAALDSVVGDGGAGAALRGAAFLAGADCGASGNASRSRRATGASTDDDGLFTYSPISLSLARTSLLVTPSSFASAETRALPATGLLRQDRAATRSTPIRGGTYSSLALHRVPIAVCSPSSDVRLGWRLPFADHAVVLYCSAVMHRARPAAPRDSDEAVPGQDRARPAGPARMLGVVGRYRSNPDHGVTRRLDRPLDGLGPARPASAPRSRYRCQSPIPAR